MIRIDLHSCARTLVACALTTNLSINLFSAGARADEGPHAHDHEHEHEEHEDIEQIFITGTPLEHASDEMAAAIDEVDRRELLKGVGTTLGESLAQRPGIASTGFAGGASRPVIRGQDAFRTGVVQDGLGTGDVSTLSPDHGVPINPLTASRLEVVRGPSTVRFGGGASAGVVNTLTNRVPRRNPDAIVTGDAFGMAGHNADERMLALLLEGGVGPVAWHVDAVAQDQNEYKVPNRGEQPGSDLDSNAFSAGGAWIGDRGRLGAAYSRFDNDYGIPEEEEDVDIELSANRLQLEGDLFDPLPGVTEVRTRWAYTDYEHDEIAGGEVGQTFENDEVEGRLEVIHGPLFGLTGALGGHFRHRDEEFGGEAAEFLAPSETRTFAGYLFEEFMPIPHVDVQLGGRVESTSLEGTPAGATRERSRSFVPLSGSLAVLIHPTEWIHIGMTGSVSQRAPASSELFARGPHEATATFELGDSNLDEETSYTGELVVRLQGGGANAAISAFYTRYEDYIFGSLTGVTVDEDGTPNPTGELDQLLYIARDAEFFGGEFSSEWEIFDLWGGKIGVDGQFDWVRARFTRGMDRDVPRITPIRWGGGLFFRSDTWNARIGALRTEEQDQISSTETETDGFTYINADLSVRMPIFEDRAGVEFFVTGRNLGDVRARNHIAFNKDEVQQRGANVRVGVRADF